MKRRNLDGLKIGQRGNHRQLAGAVRPGLRMGFVVKVGMNDCYAIDKVAMLKEGDIHIINGEYQQQKTDGKLFVSLRHEH
jgi:hypothetical protein